MSQQQQQQQQQQQRPPPVPLRVGFIGVEGSAFAMAADPKASAVAVLFSAVEQLRKYFERHPRTVCHTWVGFFHELAAANVQDREEEEEKERQQQEAKQQQQQQQQQQTAGQANSSTTQIPPPPPRQNQQQQQQSQQQKPQRRFAKAVVQRKLCLISSDAERTVTGQDIVSSTVEQVFAAQTKQQTQQQAQQQKQQQQDTIEAAQDAPFFWVDILDPPCRVHLSVRLPAPSRRAAASIAATSSYSEVLEAPAIATWKVSRILQRVAEKTGVHPHNLEVHVAYPDRVFPHLGDAPLGTVTDRTGVVDGNGSSVNDATGTIISRHSPLLDVVRSSREVNLRVVMAKPPVCSVRVVEAKFAEQATKVLYASMRRLYQQQTGKTFIAGDTSRLNFHDSVDFSSNTNNDDLGSSGSGLLDDPYSADPITIIEKASKRVISLRHVHWATTLHELHKDCNEALAPMRGRGFLCLDPNVIQNWPRDSTLFGSTGSIGGGQVPVFAPEMTLRQVARVSQEQAAAGGRRLVSGEGVQLFIVVNSEQDGRAPRMISARQTHDQSILEEADECRWNLLQAVFPQMKQARTMRTTRFKKQNVDSSGIGGDNDDDGSFSTSFNNATARQVRFDDQPSFVEAQQQQQPQLLIGRRANSSFGLVTPPKRYQSPQRNQQQQQQQPQSPFATQSRNQSPPRPSSPLHTDGIEAFIAVPAAVGGGLRSSAGGTEVIRLLLPNGFFPVRRLKRFLKLQAEQGAAGALSPRKASDEYNVYFGSELLSNPDLDIKQMVNPRTNVVFLTVS